jgi:hypothetical protein
MRERAQKIGGQFRIRSNPDEERTSNSLVPFKVRGVGIDH